MVVLSDQYFHLPEGGIRTSQKCSNIVGKAAFRSFCVHLLSKCFCKLMKNVSRIIRDSLEESESPVFLNPPV